MKQILMQMALHHQWASKVLFKKLALLPKDVLDKDMASSFSSISKTVFHLLWAESVWWQRLQLLEPILYPDEKMEENFEEMLAEILRISVNWVDLVTGSTDKKLLHVFEYRNTKREAFKQPVFQALIQVFNHQTYHQGQIITMLRQQKIDKIPATDYIAFVRSGGKV